MLTPRSHIWTPLQKRLIVGTVVAAMVLCAAGICYYERRSRVTDSVFVGTWRFPPLDDKDIYFHLNPDHTFRAFNDDVPEADTPFRGLWFGGGDFIYFRRPTFDEDGFLTNHPLMFWRVESIAPNELRVCLNPGGVPRTVRRVISNAP